MGSKSWISGRTLQQRSNLYILSLASASYEKFQANISFPPSPFPTFPAKSEANADVSVCHFSLRFLPYGEKCLLGSWASVSGLITHSKGHTTAATVCLCHYNKDTQEHMPSHNTRGKMAMLRLPHQSLPQTDVISLGFMSYLHPRDHAHAPPQPIFCHSLFRCQVCCVTLPEET